MINYFQKIKALPNFLKNFDPEEMLFIQRYGLGVPKKKSTILHLRKNNMADIPAPIFFLSTGRCGTNWFAYLLKKTKGVKVFHEPKPNLGIQGVMIYEYEKENNFSLEEKTENIFKEVIYVAREQYLRYSYKTDNMYIETNNQITFFAPIIAKMLPQAKFVHLYRHPGEFVRSALRRNFYCKDNIFDLKRIKPVKGTPDFDKWEKYSSLEKSSWLWNETNLYIEKCKEFVGKDKCFSYNFNNLSVEGIQELLEFLDILIPKEKIEKKLSIKTNVQTKRKLPFYQDWEQDDKDQLRKHCSVLAGKYGYDL